MKITELEDLLIKAASKLVNKKAAEYFAKESIEAHIRKSPRSSPIKSAIGDLEASLKNKDKLLEYVIDLPSYISINFNNHGPLVYIKKIHDELENRSAKNGIAMIAFTNSQSMHTLHTWVQGLARRGLVSIAVCNGGPAAVIPFNGTKGIFGTNPIAYGIPGKNGEIHCIDMATSEAPYFEIMNAYADKKPLREEIAVDQEGNPTIDPSKALDFTESETDPFSNLVPIGGSYKGYYLVYLMELLTSGLIGMPSSAEMSPDFVPEEHGAILIAFNPKAMGTTLNLERSVESLHGQLKNQKPKTATEIRIPGQENTRRFEEFKSEEIEMDEKLVEKLKGLCD